MSDESTKEYNGRSAKLEGGQLENGFRFKNPKPFLREYKDIVKLVKREVINNKALK